MQNTLCSQLDCSENYGHAFVGRSQNADVKCSICGIESDYGMEKYFFEKVTYDVCPLCYASRNLDVAGDFDAGVVIWLPEISQPDLNLLVSTIFSTIILGEKNGIPIDHINRMKNLYRIFESRMQPVSNFFGNSTALFNANNPLFIGQQIHQAKAVFKDQIKSDSQFIPKRIDGLRFLANSKKFLNFYKSISRKMLENFKSELPS